jgi:hypothetical protein
LTGSDEAVVTRSHFCNGASAAAIHRLPLPDAAGLKEKFDLEATGPAA